MEVSNLDFVKSFHKIGTTTGLGRRIVPSSWPDTISCVSPNMIYDTVHFRYSGHLGPSSGGHYIRMATISDWGGVVGLTGSA